MIIKAYLITYYYLLEIVKLRYKLLNYNDINYKLNNIIKKYNEIITPYMDIYNERLKKQDAKTHKVTMKPIGIDLKRLCEERLNIDYKEFENVPPNMIFAKIIDIIRKRKTENIINSKVEHTKPVVKLL